MDLTNLTLRETATLTLKHPTTREDLKDDQDKPMTVTVYGSDSKEYKRAVFELRREQAEDEKLSYQDMDERATDLLAAITADWNIQLKGDHPKCTKSAARQLYRDHPWIKDQVDKFVHARRNFFDA